MTEKRNYEQEEFSFTNDDSVSGNYRSFDFPRKSIQCPTMVACPRSSTDISVGDGLRIFEEVVS